MWRIISTRAKKLLSLLNSHTPRLQFQEAIWCQTFPMFLFITGLHKLWYPGIRDTSTWSKFGAHGDVFLFSNLGVL